MFFQLGHTNVAKLLIDHHADVNMKDKFDAIPLHRAALHGDFFFQFYNNRCEYLHDYSFSIR